MQINLAGAGRPPAPAAAGGGPPPQMRGAMDALAKHLGMSVADLRSAASNGTSLADLAAAKGESRSDLVAFMKDQMRANAPSGAIAPSGGDLDAIIGSMIDQKPGSSRGVQAATAPQGVVSKPSDSIRALLAGSGDEDTKSLLEMIEKARRGGSTSSSLGLEAYA